MIDEKKINKAIGNFLSAELKKRGITHEALSTRLKEQGLFYSASSIAAKLCRGTFSATFYMQCLIVIGYDSIEVVELKKIINYVRRTKTKTRTATLEYSEYLARENGCR